jgi:hypothetical protein
VQLRRTSFNLSTFPPEFHVPSTWYRPDFSFWKALVLRSVLCGVQTSVLSRPNVFVGGMYLWYVVQPSNPTCTFPPFHLFHLGLNEEIQTEGDFQTHISLTPLYLFSFLLTCQPFLPDDFIRSDLHPSVYDLQHNGLPFVPSNVSITPGRKSPTLSQC